HIYDSAASLSQPPSPPTPPPFPPITPRPPRSTLFPYTTLFRSYRKQNKHNQAQNQTEIINPKRENPLYIYFVFFKFFHQLLDPRSEEHTSELQSRFDLVCRLLLEKKKKDNKIHKNDNLTI